LPEKCPGNLIFGNSPGLPPPGRRELPETPFSRQCDERIGLLSPNDGRTGKQMRNFRKVN
jgi:hypothetical protein